MMLDDYERLKFGLAEALRTLSEHVGDKVDGFGERLREFFATLATDSFDLVIWGGVGQGRTTLINALLGASVLPTDTALPPSVPCTLAFGDKEGVLLEQTGGGRHLDSLAAGAARWHDPVSAQGIVSVEIKAPLTLLRRGFRFTYCRLPTTTGHGGSRSNEVRPADIYLLVIAHPVNVDDEMLNNLRACGFDRTLVVLNKQDMIDADSRVSARESLRKWLDGAFGDAAPPLLQLSARQGLEARLRHDAVALENSGLPEMERALLRHILALKARDFLQPLCEKLIALADPLRDDSGVSQFISDVRAIMRIAEKFATETPSIDETYSRKPNGTEIISGLLADWHSAVPNTSCEICERMREASFDFLRRYQRDLVTKPKARRAHAERGGLCREHMRQYVSLSSPYSVCVGYPALLESLSRSLDAAAASGIATISHDDPASWARDCVLCPVDARTEADAINALCKTLQQDSSGGNSMKSLLCMPHLEETLKASCCTAVVRQRLLNGQAAAMARLAGDMRRYAMKYDAVRRDLVSNDEAAAAGRALPILAGLGHGYRFPHNVKESGSHISHTPSKTHFDEHS